MRQVTIEKIISMGDVYYRAVKRVSTFKAGEIVKFNTTDGIKIAIVSADKYHKCGDCVFYGRQMNCPMLKSNPLQSSCLLCNHHGYMDMDLHFKPLDSVLENI